MLNLASVDNLTFESSKMPCMLYQGFQGFHLLMKFSGILHHDTWQSAIKRTITVENEKKLAVQGNALQSLKDMFFVFFLCRKPNMKTWVFVCKRTREETFTLTSSPTPLFSQSLQTHAVRLNSLLTHSAQIHVQAPDVQKIPTMLCRSPLEYVRHDTFNIFLTLR